MDPNRKLKARIAHKRWLKEHPERMKNAQVAWRKANPEYSREYALLTKYGITLQEWNVLLAKQKGGCAICHTTTPGGRTKQFHVDHDHVTGKVRGLLCSKCNQAIGLLSDSPVTIRAALVYVESHC